MSACIKLELATEGNLLGREASPYSELEGSLLYLSVCTGPDISQGNMAKPSMEHWTAAKGVLRYIAGTLKHGICFGGSSTQWRATAMETMPVTCRQEDLQ